MNFKKNKMAFTMVELIIVIAIIAVLAGIIFVAINPAKRFADTRNTRRWADISNLLDAILKYQVDNAGAHLTAIADATADKYYVIGTGTAAADACDVCTDQVIVAGTDCLDISGIVPSHIGTIPQDPSTGSSALKTEYYIMKSTAGRIKIGACKAEAPDVGKINLTR